MSLNDYMTNLKQTVMNEDIDLTKILKDCPKGTVLWSDDYGKVEFLCIDTSFSHPIRTIRTDGNSSSYTKEGWCDVDFPASCLLWPSKDQRDWSKFTAPWLKKEHEHKFHEGDWVVYNNDICQVVKCEEGCYKLVTVSGIEKELVNEKNLSTTRLWTINDETKTLEKLVKPKFDPKTLKPFDKVLVRDSHNAVWFCKWFSHIMDLSKFYKYATTGCLYRYCIPFNDETEHLVGTTDEAPEFYKYWED